MCRLIKKSNLSTVIRTCQDTDVMLSKHLDDRLGMIQNPILKVNVEFRPVVPEGARGAMAPPIFGTSVNPISIRGADYAPTLLLAPQDFQTFRRPYSRILDQKN